MKKISTLVFAFFVFNSASLFAQSCFEINSILVDACGSPEGENEMVRFTVGNTALSTTNLTVAWPNTANNYLGICQNAGTGIVVNQLNASIQACGYILEPTGGILPANSTVLLVGSENMNPAFNSFANLADTIYMIFQCMGNTAGHFKNYGSPTPRILIMDFGPGCSDTVAYIPDFLVDQFGLNVAADGATVDFNNAGNPTYTNPGCQAPVIPLGATLTTSDTLVCTGATVTLTASNLTGSFLSYQWTGGNGTIASPTSLITTYQTSATFTGIDYIVFELTGTCGNIVFDTVYINVQSGTPVSITTGGPTTFCTGDSVTLSATGGGTYLWSTGATTPSITVLASGVYTVTSNSSCGTSTASQAVTVIAPPILSINASGPTALCAGDTVTLTATGGTSYVWSTGATTPSINVSTAGTYTVSSSNTCGSDSTQIVITVTTIPTVNITASGPTVFCQGDSVILTANGTGTFLWSTGATTSSIIVLATGNYVVTLTNSCGTATASQAVTVNPGSIVSINASGPTTFCIGGSVTLTATGGTSYSWSTGATTPSITVTTTGVFTVTATTNCGTSTATQSVTVNTIPVAQITSPNLTFCQGSSTTLNASGGGTYLWSTGASTSSITVGAAATYTVTVTNSCGSSSASATTIVNPLPNAVITPGGPTTFCQGSSVTLTAGGGTSYLWSTGATTNAITVSQSGNYVVTASNSCGTSTTTQTVTVNQIPVADITADNIGLICPGSFVTLSVNTTGNILWSTLETGNTLQVSIPGTYSVVVSNTCGTDVDSIQVAASNLDVNFTQNVITGIAPLNVVFTNQSANAGVFNWNFNDGTTSTTTSPNHTFTNGGMYWVVLQGTKEGICFDYDSVLIEVIELVNYEIPNIFTPNSDGINEEFGIIGTGVKQYDMTIYNRWGNWVIEKSGLKPLLSNKYRGWDGNTSQRHECSAGVYFYVMKLELITGEIKTEKGTVTLMR